VYIEFQDCFGLYVPNAFSPNEDGVNDSFVPESDQEFVEYGFWIYDRWGKVVFKTNQPGHGWDGKINGELAPVGMYAWRISYVSANQTFGTRTERVGEVSLLR
jgi:gliding motility-associated-like protein